METQSGLSPWAHKLPTEMQKQFEMDPKERFYRTFQSTISSIQEQIGQLSSLSTVGGERQDAVEAVLAAVSRLSNEVADAAEFVPSYDLRTYTQAVRALSDQVNETTARIMPKPRFQFKRGTASGLSAAKPDSRRLVGPETGPASGAAEDTTSSTEHSASASASASATAASSADSRTAKDYNAELSRSSTPGVRRPSFSSARDVVLAGHEGLHVVLPTSESGATSAGALTDLRRCVVDMSAPTMEAAGFASLAVKNIDRSLVVAGRVSGSVHVTNVKDSVVVVAARQVRMHECENVDFYLWCASHPIIEDCKGVRFAPLPACFQTDKEDGAKNQWDQIDDFKWLKAERSPNWDTIPDEKRLPENVWRNTVSGSSGVGVDDVLRSIGITTAV